MGTERAGCGPAARVAGALRPWLSLALVCSGFSLDPRFRTVFWTAQFARALFQQAAVTIVLAVGMTFVILTAGIDLSVGSVAALCGIALGLAVRSGAPPFLAYTAALPIGVGAAAVALAALRGRIPRGLSGIAAGGIAAVVTTLTGLLVLRETAGGVRLEGAALLAAAVGIGCGLINGLTVTIGRVPPFIATLGMYTAARGLAVYATDGNSISGLPARLAMLGQEGPILAVALAVTGAGALLLAQTRPGRYIRAIGGGEEATRLSGIDVARYKTLAYAIAGFTAAVAGIVLTARFMVADTGAATGAELNAIAAVVIGGTSLSGGRGSVLGSVIGALTIAVLDAGLVLVGVKDTLQGLVVGAVIVLTVFADRFRRD